MLGKMSWCHWLNKFNRHWNHQRTHNGYVCRVLNRVNHEMFAVQCRAKISVTLKLIDDHQIDRIYSQIWNPPWMMNPWNQPCNRITASGYESMSFDFSHWEFWTGFLATTDPLSCLTHRYYIWGTAVAHTSKSNWFVSFSYISKYESCVR